MPSIRRFFGPSTNVRGNTQRLPASRRAGHGRYQRQRDARVVLNAFRHHGERDMSGSTRTAEPTSAQRLPASQRAGLSTCTQTAVRGPRIAQRLPASRRAGHLSRQCASAPASVLNAFRHHDERDLLGRSPVSPSGNRAQRLPASRRAGPTSGGRPRWYRISCGQRLPASKRAGQRCGVSPTTTPCAQRLPASRRAGLRKKSRTCQWGSGAQRLPASRRAGPRSRHAHHDRAEPVLNDFITASGTPVT